MYWPTKRLLKAPANGLTGRQAGTAVATGADAEAVSLLKVCLGPVTVAAATVQDALAHANELIQRGGNHYFCFCEASLLASLLRDAELAHSLQTAEAILPDGIALRMLARLLGQPLPMRVTGPGFLLAAAEYGVSRGWRHFLYGGSPGVAERLAERLRRDYPGIVIAGIHSPPFRPLTEAEERETTALIEATHPDLLWVCLGSPKQERWCAQHLGRLKVPLMLPVGAAFDFHSGARPWAPAWLRRVGMEWAFRTLTGGRRTFLRNLRCVSLVGLYMAKVALARLCNRPGAAGANGNHYGTEA